MKQNKKKSCITAEFHTYASVFNALEIKYNNHHMLYITLLHYKTAQEYKLIILRVLWKPRIHEQECII